MTLVDPHLQRLHRELASAVTDLSPEQLRWHPTGKWSAGEILEHLYLTYTGTSKGFGRVLEAGNPLTKIPTWKQRVQALIVVRFGYLPSGREAPAVSRPRGLPSEQVVAEVGARLAEMDEIMARCAAQFGARTKVLDHPLLGPFSVSQWRKFHLVHGLHHLTQLHRLRTLSSELEAASRSSSMGSRQ